MELHVFETKDEMGRAAADVAAGAIGEAIENAGEAHIVLATGASQFEMLASLVARDVDWSKVTAFHLDEYIGLPASHPAGFRRYLQEHFVDKAPALRKFHAVDGEVPDPAAECERLGDAIRQLQIDVACIGIGENGHLAFNDPPADFDTDEPFIIVELDEDCRKQQVGEGWFASVADVPTHAISMSIREILRAKRIVCTVPDERKAPAMKGAIEGEVTNHLPASILQQHPDCHLFADESAVSLLSERR